MNVTFQIEFNRLAAKLLYPSPPIYQLFTRCEYTIDVCITILSCRSSNVLIVSNDRRGEWEVKE